MLPWVGSGPRHDIGAVDSGRVERPRSTVRLTKGGQPYQRGGAARGHVDTVTR